MPFIFSFIAFNLLDLDGSNLTKCFDRLIIEGDIGTVPRIDPTLDRIECFKADSALTPNLVLDDGQFRLIEARALSRLESARTHRYHVSLPRDAVPG